jgi:hypothetical protein
MANQSYLNGTYTNAVGTGSTTASYTPPSTSTGTLWYRVLINAPAMVCGQAVSIPVSVMINADPTISITPPLYDLCTGAFVNLTATITGGSNLVDLQWQVYDSLTMLFVDIAGATNLNYLVPTNIVGSLAYRARITDPGFRLCSAVFYHFSGQYLSWCIFAGYHQ